MDMIESTGAYLPLAKPGRLTAAEFGELLDRAGMSGQDLATRLGKLTGEVSRWRQGHRAPPRYVGAYLEVVIAARRCGVSFEAGPGGGRPRKDHSAAT